MVVIAVALHAGGGSNYFLIFIGVLQKILSPEESLAIWHQDESYGLTLYSSNLSFLHKVEMISEQR